MVASLSGPRETNLIGTPKYFSINSIYFLQSFGKSE